MVLGVVGLTGATGMLGRHLSDALQKSGFDVLPISRSTGNINSPSWDLSRWKQYSNFDRYFKNATSIIHAGAHVPVKPCTNANYLFDANVRATYNLAAWALARNIHFIYISGAIVYKDPYLEFQRETEQLGRNELGGDYGFSKLLGEDMLCRLQDLGLSLSIVRPTSIYGFGMSSEKLIPRFMRQATSGETIALMEPTDDMIDFIHASDIAKAVISILEKKTEQVYNLSSSAPTSLIKLAKACIEVCGKGEIKVVKSLSPRRPFVRFSLDSSLAKSQLGWQASVDIYTGIELVRSNELTPKGS